MMQKAHESVKSLILDRIILPHGGAFSDTRQRDKRLMKVNAEGFCVIAKQLNEPTWCDKKLSHVANGKRI